MKQKLARIAPYVVPCLFVSVLALALFAPGVLAQGSNVRPDNLQDLRIGIFQGDKPLDVIVKIINFLLLLGGIIAFLFVLYGGFLYLTAGGDAARAGTGRTVIVNAIIGIIVIFLSYALVRFFVNFTQTTEVEEQFTQLNVGRGVV